MLLISTCAFLLFGILASGQCGRQALGGCPYGLDGDRVYRAPSHVLWGAILILTVTSTLRYGFIDTYFYKVMYREAGGNWGAVENPPWGVERLWMACLYYLNYVSESPKLMLFISALAINASFICCLNHYSADVVFSIFIYFCLSYLDTNNGIRQYFAASIAMIALLALNEGGLRYGLVFLLLVVLASLFHHSALLVAPIGFCVSGRPFNLRVGAALLVVALFLAAPAHISGFLFENMRGFKYQRYFGYSHGMGLCRAIINGVVPLYLCLDYYFRVGRHKVVSGREAFLLNLLIMNSLFVFAGLYMQYWARLTFYTSFALYAFMPKLIWQWAERRGRCSSVKTIAAWCYLFFFCYNIYVNMAYGNIKDFRVDW